MTLAGIIFLHFLALLTFLCAGVILSWAFLLGKQDGHQQSQTDISLHPNRNRTFHSLWLQLWDLIHWGLIGYILRQSLWPGRIEYAEWPDWGQVTTLPNETPELFSLFSWVGDCVKPERTEVNVPLCLKSWVVPAHILFPHSTVFVAALLPFPDCFLPYHVTHTKKERDFLFEFRIRGPLPASRFFCVCLITITSSISKCPLSIYYVLLWVFRI